MLLLVVAMQLFPESRQVVKDTVCGMPEVQGYSECRTPVEESHGAWLVKTMMQNAVLSLLPPALKMPFALVPPGESQ